MKILVTEKLSPHKYKTPEGYLVCVDAILARTGKQTYRRNEVFATDDTSEVEVDRKPEEVFSKTTLASFENKPITVEHPDEDVNSTNCKELAVGFVRDVHEGMVDGQRVMLGTLVITDAQTIEEIEDGDHTDLSCGYDCDIEDIKNPQQKNIRGNHVALCQSGRAGIARIVDSISKDSIASSLSMMIDEANTESDLDDAEYAIETAKKDGDISSSDYNSLMRELKSMRRHLGDSIKDSYFAIKTNGGQGSYVWKLGKREGVKVCGDKSDIALRFRKKSDAESWLDFIEEYGFKNPVVVELHDSVKDAFDLSKYTNDYETSYSKSGNQEIVELSESDENNEKLKSALKSAGFRQVNSFRFVKDSVKDSKYYIQHSSKDLFLTLMGKSWSPKSNSFVMSFNSVKEAEDYAKQFTIEDYRIAVSDSVKDSLELPENEDSEFLYRDAWGSEIYVTNWDGNNKFMVVYKGEEHLMNRKDVEQYLDRQGARFSRVLKDSVNDAMYEVCYIDNSEVCIMIKANDEQEAFRKFRRQYGGYHIKHIRKVNDSMKDAKEVYNIVWWDTYAKSKGYDRDSWRFIAEIKANSLKEALQKLADKVALAGVGTANAMVVRVATNTKNYQFSGKLSDLIRRNDLEDSIKDDAYYEVWIQNDAKMAEQIAKEAKAAGLSITRLSGNGWKISGSEDKIRRHLGQWYSHSEINEILRTHDLSDSNEELDIQDCDYNNVEDSCTNDEQNGAAYGGYFIIEHGSHHYLKSEDGQTYPISFESFDEAARYIRENSDKLRNSANWRKISEQKLANKKDALTPVHEQGRDDIVYVMQSDVDKNLYFYIGKTYSMRDGEFTYQKYKMNGMTPDQLKKELEAAGWHRVNKGPYNFIDGLKDSRIIQARQLSIGNIIQATEPSGWIDEGMAKVRKIQKYGRDIDVEVILDDGSSETWSFDLGDKIKIKDSNKKLDSKKALDIVTAIKKKR